MTDHTDPKRGGYSGSTDAADVPPPPKLPSQPRPQPTTAEPGCCSRPPLTAEQEIRSDALGHAIDSVTRYPGAEHHLTVLDLAEVFADWIRTGQRPGTPPACTCTPILGEPGIREADPQCPQHGRPA